MSGDNSYPDEYYPFVIKLETSNNDNIIKSASSDVVYAPTVQYPAHSLGFHHFIHANKDKMEIVQKKFENKKQVHHVMNQFERWIDNYDEDIGHVSDKIFATNNKPSILSRGYYKLWEILMMFDVIDPDNNAFVSAHLAEGPGSFIQATMFYRDKYAKSAKNDKYYAVTLHSEDESHHVPALEASFVKYYESEKPQRFVQHKTYPKQVAGGLDNKDNGDITNPKTITLFGGYFDKSKRADFITADGGFEWNNENLQEQEAYRLLLAQIIAAVKIQAKGGSFVCKFFETYTKVSIKFIMILKSLYDSIYIIKPLTSRPSNSEKYVVCKGFKYSETDKDYTKSFDILEKILKSLHKHGDDNIFDILPDVSIDDDPIMLECMIYTNITIANTQIKSINEIVDFVSSDNYYGDEYQARKQLQINANKYWIDTFLTDSDNYDKGNKTARDILKTAIAIHKTGIDEYRKTK